MRRAWLGVALALAACGDAPAPSDAAPVAIVGATVMGAAAPIEDGVVILDQGRVAAVGTRAHTAIPKGASLVDGRGHWVAGHPGGTPLGVGLPAAVALYDTDPRGAGARAVRTFPGPAR